MHLKSRVVAAVVVNVALFVGAGVASAQPSAPSTPPMASPSSGSQQAPPVASKPSSGQVTPVYTQGERVLSAGLALGGINGAAGSMSLPPIFGGFDYGFSPDISLGAVAAYYQSTLDYGFGGSMKFSYTTLAARANYHFGRFVPVEKVDLYGGLLLGYGIVSVSSSASTFGGTASTGASSNLVVWGLNVGARYFFSTALAAQVELGVGLGNLSLGLAYRL